MAGSCERCTEPSTPSKFWKFTDWLRNYKLLKKDCARGVRSIVASVMWFEIPQRPGIMLHSGLCIFLQDSIHTCNACVSRGSRDAATPLCPLSRTQTVVAGREQPHNVSPGTEEASTLRLHKTLARRRIASNTTTRSTC